MNSVTKYNLERYDNDVELDVYSTWKTHKKRIEIMINFLNKAFEKSNKSKENFQVIDIGGNTGVISQIASEIGYNITVADISDKALNKAKKRGLKVRKLDFNEDFILPDKKYDVVIAGEIIEHILDVNKFLSECNRILKDDGYLILSTPNLSTFKDRVRFLFGKMPYQINPIHDYLKLHIRHFNYSGLKLLLTVNSFNILNFKSNYFVLATINKKTLFIRFLGILFPKASASLIVLAQKNV